jgi:2'-5' RNA ligase
LLPVLQQWGHTQIPFPVTLQDYAAFKNNGVIYIDVENNDLLQLFQKDLRRKFLDILPIPEVKRFTSFHPHITIGYRDIPKEVFSEAAKEYSTRNFFATFVVNMFYLWRHNGKHWEVLHSFIIGHTAVPGSFRETF